jgi:hypothetical protein
LEYDGGSAVTVTSFYAPFPNALFSAQPQIGPGYYLRQAPSAGNNGNSSTNFVGDSIKGIVGEDLSE